MNKKSKKLTLSAETLRNLNENLNEPELQQVAGGQATRMCSILVCTHTSPCCA
jgi:hypothetical protein